VFGNVFYALKIVQSAAPLYLPTYYIWSLGIAVLNFITNTWLLREVVNRYQTGSTARELLWMVIAVLAIDFLFSRAVDVLSRFAKAVATSFDVTSDYLPGRTIVQTGLPVRAEIAGCPRFGDIPENAFTIFVTGGSQGAHRVNEIAAAALCLVAQDMKRRGLARPLHVIHQTGFNDEGTITGHYAAAGIPARVKAFEHEMGRAFASADLVIARAGASTCFELALAGKPAFFIPLPCALRDHQRFNAEAFAQAAAAHVGDQQALTPRALANWILHKIEHPQVLEKMAAEMRKLAQPDAADNVADLVERYALGG
jgi:UDP-N-acetylglucosamine--N-acetylmuramyl-(pentapeptide) pyrophosphoryl-undecaprenol N-acetylglucosamine transferase